MSERIPRLDHLLREEISAVIGREIADPRIGFVTVTKVDVAPDLGHATVWVSAIGSDPERRQSLRALGRAMPYVRRRLGSLHLRRIPELHVREDTTLVTGTRVMRIIDDLAEGAETTPTEEELAGLAELPTPGPARSLPAIPDPAVPVARGRTRRGARPGTRRAAHGGTRGR